VEFIQIYRLFRKGWWTQDGSDWRKITPRKHRRPHESNCLYYSDHEFVVHDIRVIDGNNGLFVAMPSKRTPDGEFRDIAHPINSNTRSKIQDAVLTEYHRLGELEEVEFEEAGAS